MKVQFEKTQSGSMFDSLGDQRATRLFVELIGRLSTSKTSKTKTPAEKSRALIEVIAMIDDWCEIKHLGVRSAKEEFEKRFMGRTSPERFPDLTVLAYDINSRLIPLYAPRNSTQNCLGVRVNKDVGTLVQVNTLLFVDTDGNVVRFEVHSEVKGHVIDSPNKVTIKVIGEAEITEVMGRHPLIFDYCLRNLIEMCADAMTRANERVRALERSLHAIKAVTEEMRNSDLAVNILLASEQRSHGLNRKESIALFKNIARIAGSHFDEREIHLGEQRRLLGFQTIPELAGLSISDTASIMENPDWIEPGTEI